MLTQTAYEYALASERCCLALCGASVELSGECGIMPHDRVERINWENEMFVKSRRGPKCVALLSLIHDERPLTFAQAARMETEIRRISQMSLLGDDAILSPVQVAVVVRLSVRAVGMLRRTSKLPFEIRFGDLIRWRLSDIREWVWWGVPPHQRLTPLTSPAGPVPPLGENAWLTIEHLALILGCSVRTVAKLREQCRLPPTEADGGSIGWRLGTIRRWVWGGWRVRLVWVAEHRRGENHFAFPPLEVREDRQTPLSA